MLKTDRPMNVEGILPSEVRDWEQTRGRSKKPRIRQVAANGHDEMMPLCSVPGKSSEKSSRLIKVVCRMQIPLLRSPSPTPADPNVER